MDGRLQKNNKMAYAYANLELKEGDLKFMAKYVVSHVAGNFDMLGISISADTEIIFSKKTHRIGKKVSYDHSLTFTNREPASTLNLNLGKAPSNDIIYAPLTCSAWDKRRVIERIDHCSVQFIRGRCQMVFFKEYSKAGKRSDRKKLNHLGNPLVDDHEVFDAIHYLLLNAKSVTEEGQLKHR
jgi:hypothetical protein